MTRYEVRNDHNTVRYRWHRTEAEAVAHARIAIANGHGEHWVVIDGVEEVTVE